MTLKERYKRFKAWQLNPRDWSFDEHETHHCVNCDNDFVGNFCPHCSQKAGLNKISWKSVLQSTAEVWGMHNRSFLYSLWQLIFRPGYFISDYINGKRQVSFPPVKMLVLMGVISTIVDHFFRAPVAIGKAAVKVKDGSPLLNQFAAWLESSPGWGALTIACFFLIPTWLLFRYAPRNTKHTLPQGFFIQVLMAIMVLIADDLGDLFTDYFYLLIPLSYFYAYRQLFGYSLWGNFWRVLVLIFCSFMMAVAIMIIIEMLTIKKTYVEDDFIVLALFLLLAIAPVVIGFLIGKIRFNRHGKKKEENSPFDSDNIDNKFNKNEE